MEVERSTGARRVEWSGEREYKRPVRVLVHEVNAVAAPAAQAAAAVTRATSVS